MGIMLTRTLRPATAKMLVSVVAGNAALARRLKAVLEATSSFHVEVSSGSIAAIDPAKTHLGQSALHVIEVSPDEPAQLAALERHMASLPTATPVIVISDGLAEYGARSFLKLKIADWLPSSCSDQELIVACEQALRPQKAGGAATQAQCIAFMSAVGGAGATTLGLAATTVLAGTRRDALRSCCEVDLDFQHSTLAEYLDLEPALQLDEINGRPERLDRHLLEVMLTRHSTQLVVLSAPPSLSTQQSVDPEVLGRLLELAASDFSHLVLDLPTHWQPWCDSIVRGLDALFIVTETTVTGVRQARRLAEMLQARCDLDMKGMVIANKARRFGGSLGRRQASDALGPLLAGFVSDATSVVRQAQDKGVMLSAVSSRNRVVRDLATILAPLPHRDATHGNARNSKS